MDEPMKNDVSENDEIHLLDYFIVLFEHARMITYVTIAATLLAYIVLVILPNKYTAVTLILPPQQNMTLSGQLMEIIGGGVAPGKNAGSGLGGMAAGLLGIKSSNDVYVTMMKCDTVADRIIKQFDLKKVFKVKYDVDARDKLRGMAKINADKTGIISISVTSRDSKLSAAIANTFVAEFNNLLQDLSKQEAKSRLAFLDKERQQSGLKLIEAEEALRRFSEKNSVFQIDAQTRATLEYIANLRAAIDSKEVQVQVLRQQATSVNYDVKKMETEIEGMKEKLRTAEIRYDQSCVSDVCITTSKVPTMSLDYVRLLRDVKFQEALSKLYNQLVEVARLDLVKDVAVVQVLDPAQQPERRSNKRLFPSLLVGTGAFFLMVFMAFFLEYWRRLKLNQGEAHRIALLNNYLDTYLKPIRRLINIF